MNERGDRRFAVRFPADEEIGDLGTVFRGREPLFDQHVLGVEGRGQALHRLRLAGFGGGVERRRHQHRLGGREHDVALADRPGDRHGRLVGERNLLLAPFTGRGVAAQREELALDIVERLDPQDIVGRRDIFDCLCFRRGHRGDDRHLAVGRHVLDRERNERACRDVRPVPVEEDDQLSVDDVADARGIGDNRRDIARGVDVRQFDVGGIEGLAAADHRPALVAVDECEDVHPDILMLALGQRFGGRKRGAAFPALDDARIARRGHAALAIVGRDEQRVDVLPRHAALRLRQVEAAVDEAFCRAVPFADDVGVGAAGAQRHEAALIFGGKAVGAMPDPALLLGLAERVDVDQRRPDGFPGKIGVERALPPQPARIALVAPEISDRLAHHLARHRDLAIVIEDGARALAIGLEAGACDDQLVGCRIFLFDPVQRLRALDILEPQVRVVVLRRGRCDGGEGTAEGKRGKAGADHSIISPGAWCRCASSITHPEGRWRSGYWSMMIVPG